MLFKDNHIFYNDRKFSLTKKLILLKKIFLKYSETTRNKKTFERDNLHKGFLAPRQGLEPWTQRLTAACSTN